MGNVVSGVLGTNNSFQANPAQLSTTDYSDAIKQAQAQSAGNGGPASGTIAQEQALNSQLMAAANGQVPSAAESQLQQTTAQNVGNAQGQAASQRGINPALAARMAVDNAANANQTAAGQAATLRAGEQATARGQAASSLASTAGTQLSQQQTGTQALQTAGGLQNAQNQTNVQNALGTEQINAGVAAQNANTAASEVGGIMSGAGAALGLAKGGVVPDVHDYALAIAHMRKKGYASGGDIAIPQIGIPDYSAPQYTRAGAGFAQAFNALGAGARKAALSGSGAPAAPWAGEDPAVKAAFDTQRTGERDLSPAAAPAFARGGEMMDEYARSIAEAGGGGEDFRDGGNVPGRAAVAGDSPKNDTVDAKLSPGEVVERRSVTTKPGMKKALLELNEDPDKAEEFLAALRAKKPPEKRGGGYAAVLAKNRELQKRIDLLERKMAEGGEVAPDQGQGQGQAKPQEEEHASGWGVADWINAHLPDALSARDAVVKKRARMAKMDAQTSAEAN